MITEYEIVTDIILAFIFASESDAIQASVAESRSGLYG
jgi:hypothetical protein